MLTAQGVQAWLPREYMETQRSLCEDGGLWSNPGALKAVPAPSLHRRFSADENGFSCGSLVLHWLAPLCLQQGMALAT